MSELMNARNGSNKFRWQLLSTVSAIALLATAYGTREAKATDQDADRPTVWIELGGQFEQIQTGQEVFAPPFTAVQPASGPYRQGVIPIPPTAVQNPLDYSYGAEGTISFEPEDSDWVFSAAVRYGRSNGSKHIHRSTKPLPYHIFSLSLVRSIAEFGDAASKSSESHAILDFQAGKDVGLGMFGKDSRSTVNFGVRFAQFDSALQASLGADPNNGGYKYFASFKLPTGNTRTFLGKIESRRSFHGFGPSVSWDGSAPVVGNSDGAEFTLDWGANAAILFGRQRAMLHHQTTSVSNPSAFRSPGNRYQLTHAIYHYATGHARSRSVTVPNIGGMAGLSLKFPNAKISVGYRADFFFGALDGGIDAAKKENIGFYGPFASISVGIGG